MKDRPAKGLLREILRTYNHEIVREWRYTLPITISVVVGTILIFYIPPLIVAKIIGSQEQINLSNGWQYALAFGVSWLVGELLWRFAFYLMARFEARAIYRLYEETLTVLLQKDLAFFNDRFAGSITKNALAYGRRFEMYFDTLTFGVVSQVGPAIFGIIILALISPLLAVALVFIIICVVVMIRPFVIRRAQIVRKREDLQAIMSGHISDIVSNVSAVKGYAAESRELSHHASHTKNFTDAMYESWQYHNTRIDLLISPLYVAANILALVVILSMGIDAGTKASLFLAFNYFGSISRIMWEFNGIYRRLEDALTDAALFVEYKNTPDSIADAHDAKTLEVKEGSITFDRVSFTHDTDEKLTLFSDFSLNIPAGQKVGAVGRSGAGKTTLVTLLLRFKDTDSGDIKIDNQALKHVSQQSLRENIAYVPQEPVLFHRSLRENIAYGKPDAPDAEIIWAAKQAKAYEFIEQLPHGLDTLVGERGVKLSGGQRQRIAIARAILKDAPILVLDEATSALDSESEKLIQQALEKLMKGRTSIVIAHRLSTIAKLDRIIVLENGAIIEDGTHSKLLNQNGTYAKLWSHQSGGFIEE